MSYGLSPQYLLRVLRANDGFGAAFLDLGKVVSRRAFIEEINTKRTKDGASTHEKMNSQELRKRQFLLIFITFHNPTYQQEK
jgi:hypothetical protein